MSNRTYRVTEIVGTSPDGIDQAIRNGIERAAPDPAPPRLVRGHPGPRPGQGRRRRALPGRPQGRLPPRGRLSRRADFAYPAVVDSVGDVSDSPRAQPSQIGARDRRQPRASAGPSPRRSSPRATRSRSPTAAAEPPEGVLDVRCDVTDAGAGRRGVRRGRGGARPGRGAGRQRRHHRATPCCCGCREDDWSAVIDTNLTGSFRVAKRAAKGMLRLRRGRIIFISSVVGLLGSAGQVNYAASQGRPGRHGPLARPRARQPRRSPPTSWRPGFVETDMTAVLPDEQQGGVSRRRSRSAATPRPTRSPPRSPGSPRDGAAYVTGAVIPVDGGLGMGH